MCKSGAKYRRTVPVFGVRPDVLLYLLLYDGYTQHVRLPVHKMSTVVVIDCNSLVTLKNVIDVACSSMCIVNYCRYRC